MVMTINEEGILLPRMRKRKHFFKWGSISKVESGLRFIKIFPVKKRPKKIYIVEEQPNDPSEFIKALEAKTTEMDIVFNRVK